MEYQLPGVIQIQVKPQIGLTFASGLRSIVRQDPDVILVGEIRDRETAEIAIHSALTGHMVLSTLHTQRRRRRRHPAAGDGRGGVPAPVVPHGHPRPAAGADDLRRMLRPAGRSRASSGRKSCRRPARSRKGSCGSAGGARRAAGTGYRGRAGIFELLPVTEGVKELILSRADAGAIRAKCGFGGDAAASGRRMGEGAARDHHDRGSPPGHPGGMRQWRYSATGPPTRRGRSPRGRSTRRGSAAALDRLREMGLVPIRVWPAAASGKGAEDAGPDTEARGPEGPPPVPPRVQDPPGRRNPDGPRAGDARAAVPRFARWAPCPPSCCGRSAAGYPCRTRCEKRPGSPSAGSSSRWRRRGSRPGGWRRRSTRHTVTWTATGNSGRTSWDRCCTRDPPGRFAALGGHPDDVRGPPLRRDVRLLGNPAAAADSDASGRERVPSGVRPLAGRRRGRILHARPAGRSCGPRRARAGTAAR